MCHYGREKKLPEKRCSIRTRQKFKGEINVFAFQAVIYNKIIYVLFGSCPAQQILF